MNWQHLQAFLWLRWRLRRNQLRRGGVLNAIIFAIAAVTVAVGSVVFFCVAFFVGLFAFSHPHDLGQHQRTNAVMVHFLMAVGRDQAVVVLLLEHPVDALRDGFAVFAFAGNVSG